MPMASATPHIQIVIGSVRAGRASAPVARWIAERFESEFGRPAEIVDLRDWRLPDFDLMAGPAMGLYPDRLQRAWAASVARADGFVFVTPEYNHGYSGALKNAFDWVYAEWAGKPGALVSFGNANGARGVQQVKHVMSELRMVSVEPMVGLRAYRRVQGRTFAGSDDEAQRLSRAFAELLRWEEVLRPLRRTRPDGAGTGRRVLVAGLDPATNRHVVSLLNSAGVEAAGLVLKSGEPMPDGAGFDLIAIGRGAAGPLAAAVRQAVWATAPDKPVIDVVGPLAARQILAALDPNAPRLEVTNYAFKDGRISLTVEGDDGRLSVTVLESEATGLVSHRVATVDLRGASSIELTIDKPVYSIVIDLDGAAFRHFPALS